MTLQDEINHLQVLFAVLLESQIGNKSVYAYEMLWMSNILRPERMLTNLRRHM